MAKEQQSLVKHLQSQKKRFKTTVDLAIYLKKNRDGDLKEYKEPINDVLKSGYKSEKARQLLNDINDRNTKKQEASNKQEEKK